MENNELNLSQFNIAIDDDIEFAEILHTEFQRSTHEAVGTLRTAMDGKDEIQISQSSHFIKGASRNLGFIAIASTAEQLERQSKQSFSAVDATLITLLAEQIESAVTFFDNYIKTNGSH